MARRCFSLWVYILLTAMPVCSQELVYRAGVHSFFNNNEFFGSSVKHSQTLAGVHFVPQFGVALNARHRVLAGVDALHEFGSKHFTDRCDPVLYYQFDGRPFTFYMGAFPRQQSLDRYPRMFFQDSVLNYRPVVNGLFWEYRSERDNYMNVWLDWTGRQSMEHRETFFMGWSGRFQRGIVYAQHFAYMFHFAGRMAPPEPEEVHDNGLMLTSIGVDLAEQSGFEKLELNAGFSAGLEKDRADNVGWQRRRGFLSELKVEYMGVGLLNTFYAGRSQQLFYRQYGNQLYWGDQAYRARRYDRADLYVHFIRTKAVNVRLVYSLHFLDNNMFHEQALYASFDLDNLPRRKHENYRRFWSNWFKQKDKNDGNDD